MRGENGNFIMVCLKGASQVFFMENVITGALFLVAIFYASFVSQSWATSIGAIVGVIVATAVAYMLDFDASSRASGPVSYTHLTLPTKA